MFVYEILNTINGKRYIGQSGSKRDRWTTGHRSNLRGGYHDNPHLQAAWDKYGEASFRYTKLVFTDDQLELNRLEEHYIEKYRTCERDYGYNIAKFAESPMRGRKHSTETLELMSKQRKGKKKSAKQKERSRASNKATWSQLVQDEQFMQEHRAKSGNAWRGKTLSDEHRANLKKSSQKHAVASSLAQRTIIYKPLRSPTGQVHEVTTTLQAFCNEHGLNTSHIRSVFKGTRNHHQGWTLA